VLSEHRFGPAPRVGARRAPCWTVRYPSMSRSSSSPRGRQFPLASGAPGCRSLAAGDFARRRSRIPISPFAAWRLSVRSRAPIGRPGHLANSLSAIGLFPAKQAPRASGVWCFPFATVGRCEGGPEENARRARTVAGPVSLKHPSRRDSPDGDQTADLRLPRTRPALIFLNNNPCRFRVFGRPGPSRPR
jgi:hypothetical protein